jgi:hypothetical protein
VRQGPHGSLFAALTRKGTPVNAAVSGPVNAAPVWASTGNLQACAALDCPRLVLGAFRHHLVCTPACAVPWGQVMVFMCASKSDDVLGDTVS